MGGKHVIGVVAELKREGKLNEIGTFSLVIFFRFKCNNIS